MTSDRRRPPGRPSLIDRAALPQPISYFAKEHVRLLGRGTWRSALCPFHDDSTPSLRVHIVSGGFVCFACGASGGDVLAFHQRRHRLSFKESAQTLGAWRGAAQGQGRGVIGAGGNHGR